MFVLRLIAVSSEHILIKCDLPSDDPAIFKGTPISLQLVGRTLEDEAVIRLAEIVDAAIKKLWIPEES
jgi:Asp-tRNA(Asn)/Glu-tRNA(Gln) amidotransferase A subunit family amidase